MLQKSLPQKDKSSSASEKNRNTKAIDEEVKNEEAKHEEPTKKVSGKVIISSYSTICFTLM